MTKKARLRDQVRLSCAILGALSALVLPAGDAQAAQAGVNFGVNIYYHNLCSIVLQENGTLAPNGDNTLLSSKQPGGAPGKARVTSFGAYDLTADEVSFFLSDPGNMSLGSTFVARFSGQAVNNRGRTFAERDGGNAMRLRTGYSITDVTVNLDVTRPNGFAAGDYTALTIVRCE